MKIKNLLLTFFAALLVFSCGKPAGESKEPTAGENPPGGTSKIRLVLFGAPWCTNCKSDFPKIDEALSVELTKPNARLTAEMYVPTGDTGGKKPTQEVADKYRDFLKLHFTAKVDPWRWQTFKKYVGKEEYLPAAVVLNDKDETLKVYARGATSFIVEDIVKFVNEQLSK